MSQPGVLASPEVSSLKETGSVLLGNYKRAPVQIVGGEGVWLEDVTGRRYLDFVSGIGVNALGYGDAAVAAAMRAAADGLVHTSNLFATRPGEDLARALVDRSFADSVFFCNSGAEANEGAMKFARRWARSLEKGDKHRIVALRGSFHGRLFASVAATDRPAFREPFAPLAAGIGIVERDIEDIADALEAGTSAALILEPVQGEGGVRVLDPAFVREIRELTREREVALIFDEVQCGLGRTGYLFDYERLGVEPDLLTLAKPLAGGLPMGAVLLTDEIARTIKPGDHGTTFGGGPFVATVAAHVFGRISEPAFLNHVRSLGPWIGERLSEIAGRTGRIRQVRGVGFMWGIDIMGSAADVVDAAREAGLLLCTAGEHTVRILPPLVARREELAVGFDLLEGIL